MVLIDQKGSPYIIGGYWEGISQIFLICDRKSGNYWIDSNDLAIHMALILLLSPLIVNKIIKIPLFPGKNKEKRYEFFDILW